MVFLFFIFLGQTTCLLEDDQKSGRFVWGSLWTKEELKITQGESGPTERGPSAQGVWPNLWRTVFNILAMLTRYSIWDCKSLFPTISFRFCEWSVSVCSPTQTSLWRLVGRDYLLAWCCLSEEENRGCDMENWIHFWDDTVKIWHGMY